MSNSAAKGSVASESSAVRMSPARSASPHGQARDLPRGAVLDRRHAQAYRGAVYLLRRVVNEPIGKVARRAGISAPRVSQIQAEVESAKPADADPVEAL